MHESLVTWDTPTGNGTEETWWVRLSFCKCEGRLNWATQRADIGQWEGRFGFKTHLTPTWLLAFLARTISRGYGVKGERKPGLIDKTREDVAHFVMNYKTREDVVQFMQERN